MADPDPDSEKKFDPDPEKNGTATYFISDIPLNLISDKRHNVTNPISENIILWHTVKSGIVVMG